MTPAGSHQREVGETGTCAPLPGTSRLTSHTLSKAPPSDAPETQALDILDRGRLLTHKGLGSTPAPVKKYNSSRF